LDLLFYARISILTQITTNTMRTMKIKLFVIFSLLNGFVFAQDISSALGRIDTNFVFYSDSIDLEVSSQFIIKKAGTFHYEDSRTSDSDGWGYGFGYGGGYESHHLEFVTIKKLVAIEKKQVDYKFEIDFVDSTKTIIASETFDESKVSHYNNDSIIGSPHFYSIDLITIPISVLDRTSEIFITEIKSKKRFFW
jgi:hypothetical protein